MQTNAQPETLYMLASVQTNMALFAKVDEKPYMLAFKTWSIADAFRNRVGGLELYYVSECPVRQAYKSVAWIEDADGEFDESTLFLPQPTTSRDNKRDKRRQSRRANNTNLPPTQSNEGGETPFL